MDYPSLSHSNIPYPHLKESLDNNQFFLPLIIMKYEIKLCFGCTSWISYTSLSRGTALTNLINKNIMFTIYRNPVITQGFGVPR